MRSEACKKARFIHSCALGDIYETGSSLIALGNWDSGDAFTGSVVG